MLYAVDGVRPDSGIDVLVVVTDAQVADPVFLYWKTYEVLFVPPCQDTLHPVAVTFDITGVAVLPQMLTGTDNVVNHPVAE